MLRADKPPITGNVISSKDSLPKTYEDTLRLLEEKSIVVNYDSLGTLISTIGFEVNADKSNDDESGKKNWIRIDSAQRDLKNLRWKDAIIIPDKKLTIIIDYPLSSNYTFELSSDTGFSREHLVTEICRHYYLLYEEEEKTATVKTIPLKERKIYNRNQTNGKYGIWGHDISDLILSEILVRKTDSGEIILTLQMES